MANEQLVEILPGVYAVRRNPAPTRNARVFVTPPTPPAAEGVVYVAGPNGELVPIPDRVLAEPPVETPEMKAMRSVPPTKSGQRRLFDPKPYQVKPPDQHRWPRGFSPETFDAWSQALGPMKAAHLSPARHDSTLLRGAFASPEALAAAGPQVADDVATRRLLEIMARTRQPGMTGIESAQRWAVPNAMPELVSDAIEFNIEAPGEGIPQGAVTGVTHKFPRHLPRTDLATRSGGTVPNVVTPTVYMRTPHDLDPARLESIVAHELGHVRDIRQGHPSSPHVRRLLAATRADPVARLAEATRTVGVADQPELWGVQEARADLEQLAARPRGDLTGAQNWRPYPAEGYAPLKEDHTLAAKFRHAYNRYFTEGLASRGYAPDDLGHIARQRAAKAVGAQPRLPGMDTGAIAPNLLGRGVAATALPLLAPKVGEIAGERGELATIGAGLGAMGGWRGAVAGALLGGIAPTIRDWVT